MSVSGSVIGSCLCAANLLLSESPVIANAEEYDVV
jgi:hypothetical protein